MWFEIYHEGQPWDGTNGFRWRLKSANGKILADSGEAYSSFGGAKRAINGLKHELRFIDVEIRDAR